MKHYHSMKEIQYAVECGDLPVADTPAPRCAWPGCSQVLYLRTAVLCSQHEAQADALDDLAREDREVNARPAEIQ